MRVSRTPFQSYELIKAQLIYPVVDLPLYREQIPPEEGRGEEQSTTVRCILAGLMTAIQPAIMSIT